MRSRLVFLLLAGVAFFLWHSPLLSEAGRVRGFNSDAAIIALMGKKMLDGRGFDIFFWGQNYVGPLSSMFIAAAGALLGGVNALAMRIGVFVEVLAAIMITYWTIARVDPRAARITAVLLVLTPPVILRMMITPLGAEMAFLMSAVLAAIVVQHLTAPDDRGWLARSPGQIAFGIAIGVGWWMNQQVIFTLFAAALTLAARSALVAATAARVRPLDRILLRGDRLRWRRAPGVVLALAAVLTVAGCFLLLAFVVMHLASGSTLPFVVGPVTDALVLIVLPHLLLPLVLGEWRQWELPRGARARFEVATLIRVAFGAVIGYIPVILGRVFGWYDRSYTFAFAPSYPRDMIDQAQILLGEVLPHTLGLEGFAGWLWAPGCFVFAALALRRIRHEPVRLFLATATLSNLAFFIITRGGKPHYFIGTVAFLFALAALGICDAWASRHQWTRAIAAVGLGAAVVSVALSAHTWHREVLSEPDPLPLLARVEQAGCAVTYADFWVAYRYRLLDGERRAWVPYQSQNRTRPESVAAQKLQGQRCLVTRSGIVQTLNGDLPLQWNPRAINPRARPSV